MSSEIRPQITQIDADYLTTKARRHEEIDAGYLMLDYLKSTRLRPQGTSDFAIAPRDGPPDRTQGQARLRWRYGGQAMK